MERDLGSTLMKGKQLPPPRPHARYCRGTSKSRRRNPFKVEALSQLQQAELRMLSGLPLPAPNQGPVMPFLAGIKAWMGRGSGLNPALVAQ